MSGTAASPNNVSSDIAFTSSVKAMQERRGSRRSYAKLEMRGGFRTAVTPDLAAFLSQVDSAVLSTANALGQPYAQHRGGPKGFIKVIDDTTLGFADYSGNKQYITLGNLAENSRAFLLLIDYATGRRIKLWGHARVVDDDAEMVRRLMPPGYDARPEQVIVFAIAAWDVNCPQHIPQKFDAADVAKALEESQARIAALESENAALRHALAQPRNAEARDPSSVVALEAEGG
jgi:predicted pyridoxine 5'-phosphate oxidase superfamily flavin-nucleotide-binding protein